MKRMLAIVILMLGLLPLGAQNDYYVKQAQSYQREAEYYTKQALGYEREVDYYNRQAQRYLRDAEYYSKRKKYDSVKTYQQWVAKTEHSHPDERFNPFTFEPKIGLKSA